MSIAGPRARPAHRVAPLTLSTALIALAFSVSPARSHAQLAQYDEGPRLDLGREGDERLVRPLLSSADRYIIIRLSENRLYLLERERILWSAPVGTGTGFRLESAGRSWQFDTPRGVFRVQRKEKDPVWIKPDWAFIKEGLPIPPLDSPLRRHAGMLGNTAVYIGYELAIHGTDRPELVLRQDPDERRVSHGCIRMTNEDVRALYYLIDVGTPVLIY